MGVVGSGKSPHDQKLGAAKSRRLSLERVKTAEGSGHQGWAAGTGLELGTPAEQKQRRRYREGDKLCIQGSVASQQHHRSPALGNWIPLVDPIDAKVVGEVERPDIGKAESVQPSIRGPDVRAFIPGAASAVNNNERTTLQSLYSILKRLQPSLLSRRPSVLRSGDVRLAIKNLRANLQDHGSLRAGRAQELLEILRLQ